MEKEKERFKIFKIGCGVPGCEECNTKKQEEFGKNLLDVLFRQRESVQVVNDYDSLPDNIRIPFREFEAVWKTERIVPVNLKEKTFVASLRISKMIVFNNPAGKVTALYAGEMPRVLKRAIDAEITEKVEAAIEAESQRKNFLAEQKIIETAKSASEDKLLSLQKLLDRKLVCHCTDLMTFNGAPHMNLVIEKDGPFGAGYVVSFRKNGEKKDKIPLYSMKGKELFDLQTEIQGMDLILSKQKGLLGLLSFKLGSLVEDLRRTLVLINGHFYQNPVSEGEIFAVAIDPKDNEPRVFVMTDVNEETTNIPADILRKLILDHLTGEKILSTDQQNMLGVPEVIKEIEEIFSRL